MRNLMNFPLIATMVAALITSSASFAGLNVTGNTLVDGNGNPFILRGINYPHAWFSDKASTSYPAMAATGANSVRVVLSNGVKWSSTPSSEVENLIALAKANNLISVVEIHDTTGYGEESGTSSLSQAVDYWLSIQAVLEGEEDYVILNIGNEPFGNSSTASDWIDAHTSAIKRLRDNGFKHTIMVDAPNWGQDWTNTMRDNAQSVFNSDPDSNTIFSVHMYEVYDSRSTVESYMNTFAANGLHLVVGEFADNHFDKDVADEAIMELAETHGFGYMGWSWKGNGSDLGALDIANDWSGNSYTTWGQKLVNGSYGLAATASTASIFHSGPQSSSASSSSVSSAASSNNSSSSSNTQQCNWYGTLTVVCANTNTSWGWENNASCISANECTSAGQTLVEQNPTSSSSSSSAPSSSSSSSSVSSSSSSSSSVSSSSSSSSSVNQSLCNWYGTNYPMCTSTSTGWGWENSQSCIAPSTCNAQ